MSPDDVVLVQDMETDTAEGTELGTGFATAFEKLKFIDDIDVTEKASRTEREEEGNSCATETNV